ncbi:uncharacterized protein N7484_001728 [Penicillium longicatenatum]|uniref:uncharacterized protein n=1 Tax=Penicillium longicatenatum TaxID=1561947 RepID=UPI002548CC5B|nr:uncharacterized protein N7484_001728 [Penicillium longicatenatum]KAJ5658079.1 hypothetical protein N7484_001728 [Penicillium longicatenatum]
MIPLRQIARQSDRVRLGSIVPIRQFSVSRSVAAEGDGKPRTPSSNLKSAASKSKPPKSAAASSFKPRPSSKPPGSGPPNRPRTAKALDARAFAAPRAGGEQAKVIRSPRSRTARGGNQPQGKPKPAAKKNQRKPRTRVSRKTESDEGEDVIAAAIEQIEQEKVIKARPTPVRYEPQEIDFTSLQQTWPSLPTDTNARSAAVLEKLSSLSGRFPNGYVPPYELGRRIWKGQNVLFHSEAERMEAMEEVKRLAKARADKMSQQKGDLVEPRDIEFNAIKTEESKILLETYAQGKYPTVEVVQGKPAVLGEVMKNLRNNGTYQTTGKRPQFLAKVESLLASGRVKR